MFIEKITLNNFRVYKGVNEITLSVDHDRNVSIVSGNNGFGKTSLLTSLVWCLYGKLMVDVDDRYRKEIYESGGYKRFCDKTMNRVIALESKIETEGIVKSVAHAGIIEKNETSRKIANLNSFSVSIRLTKIFIPSIPCEYVQITRTYNVYAGEETVEILIDGRINELTKEVGYEIFINDFILPKEIAKFFFFDAERIVSLAEIRSVDEKRSLSQAYAEVLGIKKYLDLKENLENLRLRLRKKATETGDKQKLDKLKKQFEQNKKLISHSTEMITEKEEELALKRVASDRLQEQLIREGTAITLDELKDFKQMREHLSEEGTRIKNRLKEMMELAPFAIAGNKLNEAVRQLEAEEEHSNKEVSDAFLNKRISVIKKALEKNRKELSLDSRKEEKLLGIIKSALVPERIKSFKALFNFSTEQHNKLLAIYENLQNAYSKNFRHLIAELKKQQSAFNIVSRKLQDAESKENDPVIKAIRSDKIQLDLEIKNRENDLVDLKAKRLNLQNETTSLSSQVSELTKKVSVEDVNKAKDELAKRLIEELDDFIHTLKIRKKASLEKNILRELNRLMHKSTFIGKVEVIIDGDLIDIELYDRKHQLINKDGLSKGEQQLYATAILKALVDESNIRFPVFIDSPLQKFDKEHARNIIKDFYPDVSGQVILFPLLEKELNEQEYSWLLPRVGSSYLINYVGQYHSEFTPVNPEKLFATYRKKVEHVYQH